MSILERSIHQSRPEGAAGGRIRHCVRNFVLILVELLKPAGIWRRISAQWSSRSRLTGYIAPKRTDSCSTSVIRLMHKILDRRREAFSTLRQFGGIAGFPKPDESVHDAFVAGHASTSISVALGMARARTHKADYDVIALIGDGALLTGGLAYEGLSDAGQSGGADGHRAQRQRHVHQQKRRRRQRCCPSSAWSQLSALPRFTAIPTARRADCIRCCTM